MPTLLRVKAGEKFLKEAPKDNFYTIYNKSENQRGDKRKNFQSPALT